MEPSGLSFSYEEPSCFSSSSSAPFNAPSGPSKNKAVSRRKDVNTVAKKIFSSSSYHSSHALNDKENVNVNNYAEKEDVILPDQSAFFGVTSTSTPNPPEAPRKLKKSRNFRDRSPTKEMNDKLSVHTESEQKDSQHTQTTASSSSLLGSLLSSSSSSSSSSMRVQPTSWSSTQSSDVNNATITNPTKRNRNDWVRGDILDMEINNQKFKLRLIGIGNMHHVFAFEDDRRLTLKQDSRKPISKSGTNITIDISIKKEMSFNTGNKVVKIPFLNPRLSMSARGYENTTNKISKFDVFADEEYRKSESELNQLGIYLPKAYKLPDPNEEFSIGIYDKMAESISCDEWRPRKMSNGTTYYPAFDKLSNKSKKTLEVIEKVLSSWANTENCMIDEMVSEPINDLYPRNFMLDDKGRPNYIDPSPKQQEWINMQSYLREWSNGNPNIFEFLTKRFPKEARVNVYLEMERQLKKLQEKGIAVSFPPAKENNN